MRIGIGSDHAGFEYKEIIKNELNKVNKTMVVDYGTDNLDPVDYPDFAHAVSFGVQKNETDVGILICGSANGVAIAANKHKKIRAAVCWTEEISILARTHNHANVLCIPARFISIDLTIKIMNAFINTSFEGGRHLRRVKKINFKE